MATLLLLYSEIRLYQGCQKYLKIKISLAQYQIIAQLRLLNLYNFEIISEKNLQNMNELTICHKCCVQNSSFRMLCECVTFKEKILKTYLPMHGDILEVYGTLETPRSLKKKYKN